MASIFDIDVTDSIARAAQMVRSGLAPDMTTAFDLIFTGMQRIPSSMTGDMLDAIDEYSKHLAPLGVSGEQIIAMIVNAFMTLSLLALFEATLTLPGIAGIDDFTGKAFHTTRWDYEYTGGSPTEPMDRLADKVGPSREVVGASCGMALPNIGGVAIVGFYFDLSYLSIKKTP